MAELKCIVIVLVNSIKFITNRIHESQLHGIAHTVNKIRQLRLEVINSIHVNHRIIVVQMHQTLIIWCNESTGDEWATQRM